MLCEVLGQQKSKKVRRAIHESPSSEAGDMVPGLEEADVSAEDPGSVLSTQIQWLTIW